MTLHRYVYVVGDRVNEINALLNRGWHPVREVPPARNADQEGTSSSDSGGTLILLEKESDFPQYTNANILDDIPVTFFQQVSLFDNFTMDELRELIAQSEVQSYGDDDFIFRDGDVADSVYVILQGEVTVQMPVLPITETEIVTLKAADVFGESTFYSPAPHTVSVKCSKPSTAVLKVTRSVYDEFLQAGHPLAWKMALNAARLLASRLQETDRWMHDLLQEEQDGQIAAKWHRFRSRMSKPTYTSSRGFGL